MEPYLRPINDAIFKFIFGQEGNCDLALRRFMWECDRMTLIAEAEDAKKEGREEGRQEGREEGKTEGPLLEKQAVLIRLLKLKFDLDDERTSFINQLDNPEKLDKALDSIVTAETAEEILEDLKDR